MYESITPAADVTFTAGTVSGTYTSPTALSGDYTLSLYVGGLGFWETDANASLASGDTVSFTYALEQPITISAGVTYVVALSQVVIGSSGTAGSQVHAISR